MNLDFTKHIFCVVTGASRGIGRQITVDLAGRTVKTAKKITFLLIARNAADLTETKNLIEKMNGDAVVHCQVLDLAADDSATVFKRALTVFEPKVHEVAVLFHNAGQIGQIGKTYDLRDYARWQNYYQLNMFSAAVLTAVFLELVATSTDVFVVNVTSLVGRQPFKYLSMYGSVKAARDMYFKVLALEEPRVRVLNYSPGMVETSMASELIENIGNFEDSEISAAVKENPTKLTTEQTVTKLMTILEKGAFNTGDVIDYYD